MNEVLHALLLFRVPDNFCQHPHACFSRTVAPAVALQGKLVTCTIPQSVNKHTTCLKVAQHNAVCVPLNRPDGVCICK